MSVLSLQTSPYHSYTDLSCVGRKPMLMGTEKMDREGVKFSLFS